jgi:quercetin dioxygenase-like cupin family protein
MSANVMSASVALVPSDQFMFRAPLEPFHIVQPPDFMAMQKGTKDIVIQRSMFAPGPTMWHFHPGPSFIYVLEGQIKVERAGKKGCTETPVFQSGDAYFEIANEVHRAVVTSEGPAWLLVMRFNIPVGQPFTVNVPAPDC